MDANDNDAGCKIISLPALQLVQNWQETGGTGWFAVILLKGFCSLIRSSGKVKIARWPVRQGAYSNAVSDVPDISIIDFV